MSTYDKMSIGARELWLYMSNDGQCHRMKMAINKNLATKKARGIYKAELGRKGFTHLAKFGAERYVKEICQGSRMKWHEMFPVADRKQVAAVYEETFREEWANGDFESILPKKYQKAKTKKASCDARAKALSINAGVILIAMGKVRGSATISDLEKKSMLRESTVTSGLNELVSTDLVTEGSKGGARAWKLNACGKSVLRTVKRG